MLRIKDLPEIFHSSTYPSFLSVGSSYIHLLDTPHLMVIVEMMLVWKRKMWTRGRESLPPFVALRTNAWIDCYKEAIGQSVNRRDGNQRIVWERGGRGLGNSGDVRVDYYWGCKTK